MGGKKKLSLKQMERAQSRQDSKEKGKEKTAKAGGTPSRTEKKTPKIVAPNQKDEEIIKEMQKMKVLTPYVMASRFDLRISAAKDLLEDLHRRGVVTLVSGGRNTKIYKPS